MTMNKYAAILLLASLAPAQTPPPAAPVPEQLVYEFKNVSYDRMISIANFVQLLMNGRVQISVNSDFKTAILRPGMPRPTAEDMAKAEELLKRYDVAPPPQPPAPPFDFVAYLVRASNQDEKQPAATPQGALSRGSAVPAGQPIPPVLEDAVAEMKKTFSYKEYSLLDTVETQVQLGQRAKVEDLLPVTNSSGVPYFYEIEYGNTSLGADRKTVTVSGFHFALRIPIPPNMQYQNAGVTTNVQIREGEKLVLGKVRVSSSDSSDVFLVLTVRLR